MRKNAPFWFGAMIVAAMMTGSARAGETPTPKEFTAADLPATLPGYKLVELDVKKEALVKNGNTLVQVQLPVFVYFPTEFQARKSALVELHNLYDQMVELAGKPAATAADFEHCLVVLDKAMSGLETNPAPHPADSADATPVAAK